MPDLLTIKEAAEFLRVSDRTLARRIKRGEIAYYSTSGNYRFSHEQLTAYLSRNEVPVGKVRPGWGPKEMDLTNYKVPTRAA